ncbi:hypothetical protein FOL46_005824, partial [Perkinsus olseni]
FALVSSLSTDLNTVVASTDVCLVSFYIPPGSDNVDSLWQLSERLLHNDKIVLGGDCNGYHEAWGILHPERRNEAATRIGKLVMDFASVCLLECTNDNVGLKPTYKHIGFHDDSHESIVDVTFHGTGVDILDWKVDDEEHLSDHFAILFKVDLNIDEEASAPSTLCSGFSYYKTDWHKYSHYLEQHAGMLQLSPIDSVDVLIERERSLIGLLQDAVKFSTPRRKPANRKSKDWWDDSCRKARSELKKTKRMHGSHSEEYKSSRLTYKQLIKSKKAFSFEILANNIEHDKNYLRKVKNPARMGGSLLDGDIIPEETVNRLATAYMGSEPCAMDPTEDNEGIETGLERLDPYLAQDYETPDIQVDLGDVKSLLASRRGNWNKVGGSDGLRMKHFATAPDPYLQAVALIVSASVNLGYVPVSWKHSEVCFLPKNKNLGKINGVRPISLTNVLGKITEAFILSRLQPIEDELLRSDISYGYLPNRSTIKLVNHIKRSLNRNNPWAIAALDCSNAFGEIKHSYIVDSLVRHHADPRLVMWVKGWLAHRTNSTEYLGIHTQRLSPNGIGTPQGAILSPFLFNLTCYDALVALRSSICNAYPDLAVDLLSYADDSFIIINFQKGSLGNAMDDLIQDIIQLSNGAFQPLGLIISVVKTCVLTSYESTSYVDDTICILGITISRNLTFYSHLVRVVDKCRSRISLVMRYVRKAYGLTPSAMVRIFDVSVLPVLTYGLGCYGVALAEKRSMALLDRLEISYLKAALRVPRSTPTREVLLLAGRRPLSEVLLDQLCMNFLHKKEVRDNLLTGAGKQLRNKFMKELAIRTNGNVNCDMYELKWKLDRIDIGTREKCELYAIRKALSLCVGMGWSYVLFYHQDFNGFGTQLAEPL